MQMQPPGGAKSWKIPKNVRAPIKFLFIKLKPNSFMGVF